MSLSRLNRNQIVSAIAECRKLGTEAFLRKHGYRLGRYVIKHRGQMLPSKAIVGVAAGKSASEFSGGQARLGRILRRLGFVFIKVAVVAILSCSKAKAATARAARDLYEGALFRKARAFADKYLDGMVILSALHGLLSEGDEIAPYDTMLSDRKGERADWRDSALSAVRGAFDLEATLFVILCGQKYAEGFIAATDIHTIQPFKGVCRGIGDQMSWLDAALQASS